MNEDKTHYRKAFDSPYLSSADIVDPIVVTVRRVTLEADKTKKTKDLFNTAYFAEPEIRPGEKLKPMILNATNSKMLAQITGSKWIDDWSNVPITIYVDNHVRFGKETVEGLRISKATERVRAPSPELVSAATKAASEGVEKLKAWWNAASEEDRELLLSRFKELKQTAARADAQKVAQ